LKRICSAHIKSPFKSGFSGYDPPIKMLVSFSRHQKGKMERGKVTISKALICVKGDKKPLDSILKIDFNTP